MSRDQFEQLLAVVLAEEFPAPAEQILTGLVAMRDGDRYVSYSVTGRMIAKDANYAWWAWKASRAAVVVELPDRQQLTGIGNEGFDFVKSVVGDWLDADACSAAIEAAGLKVAP